MRRGLQYLDYNGQYDTLHIMQRAEKQLCIGISREKSQSTGLKQPEEAYSFSTTRVAHSITVQEKSRATKKRTGGKILEAAAGIHEAVEQPKVAVEHRAAVTPESLEVAPAVVVVGIQRLADLLGGFTDSGIFWNVPALPPVAPLH
jgi:hypothetical protein